MHYEEFPAPDDLRAHVRALWVVDGEGGERIRVTPDACTDLIALDDRATSLLFVGPMSRAEVVALRLPRSVGVQLRPGTLALVRPGLRLRALRDRDLVIAGLPPSNDPLDGILTRVRAMEVAGELGRHPDVDRVLAAMEPDSREQDAAGRDTPTVDDVSLVALYDRLGLRERTVQRLFDRFVGLTPKQTATVLRQRRATRMLRAGEDDLARLAAGLGYADQAHLTRDYRAQVGLTPGRYRMEIQGVGFVQDAGEGAGDNGGRSTR